MQETRRRHANPLNFGIISDGMSAVHEKRDRPDYPRKKDTKDGFTPKESTTPFSHSKTRETDQPEKSVGETFRSVSHAHRRHLAQRIQLVRSFNNYRIKITPPNIMMTERKKNHNPPIRSTRTGAHPVHVSHTGVSLSLFLCVDMTAITRHQNKSEKLTFATRLMRGKRRPPNVNNPAIHHYPGPGRSEPANEKKKKSLRQIAFTMQIFPFGDGSLLLLLLKIVTFCWSCFLAYPGNEGPSH